MAGCNGRKDKVPVGRQLHMPDTTTWARINARFFPPLIHSREEETISSPSHDRVGAGEKKICEWVAHAAYAKFVAGVVFSEKIDDLEDLPTFSFQVIEPSERRHYDFSTICITAPTIGMCMKHCRTGRPVAWAII